MLDGGKLVRNTTNFLIIQYADDTLLIMEACPQELFVLKALLNTFADSIGLKVNLSKSSMVPTNLDSDRLNHLASTFNCEVGLCHLHTCDYL
jgi:hypothetical protein